MTSAAMAPRSRNARLAPSHTVDDSHDSIEFDPADKRQGANHGCDPRFIERCDVSLIETAGYRPRRAV
jgi:hypothetical protein